MTGPAPGERPAPATEDVGSYAGRSKYDAPGRAARYEARSQRRDAEEKALLDRVLDALALPRGARALDAPCGTGRIAQALLARGWSVTAADLSPAMREAARAALGGAAAAVTVEPIDLEATPPPDAPRHDVVVCFRFFHHLPDDAARTRVLRSLAARTRGPVVLSFHHPVSAHHLARALRRLLTGRRGDRHATTVGHLRRLARDAGLAVRATVALAPYRRDLWVAVLEAAPAAASTRGG